MRCRIAIVALVVAGCGGGGNAAPEPTPVHTPIGVGGPWSAAVPARAAPLACPVASSRSGDPARVLALGDGRFARLAGPYTSLADVRADDRELRRVPLGTCDGEVTTWALACGAGGQLAAAWVEDGALRLATRPPGGALTAPLTLAEHALDQSDRGEIALAFAPDGELLLVYAVPYAVHAITVSPAGDAGADVVLGKASGISQVAAEIAADGRAVVAWDTEDGGEERNSPHAVSAATRARGGWFGRAQLIDPGTAVDPDQYVGDPRAGMRLAVAPDGRAIVLYGAVTAHSTTNLHHPLRVAESTADGRFGPPKRIAAAGVPGAVAIRADGSALALWAEAGWLRAAVHPPGERFRRSELLTRDNVTDTPTAAFRTDGRPQAGWTTDNTTYTTTRTIP